MRYATINASGEIILLVNANYETVPADYYEIDSDKTDLELIENFYFKNGELKEKPPRPSLNHLWDLQTEQWLLNLNLMKSLKSRSILDSCKNAIVSGFVSYALGQPYHYPSKTLDQQNLAASVLASYDPENAPDWTTPFWCSDAAGEWAFRPHTAAQIREVGRDAKSAIITYQLRNESLQAAILAATSAEQLDAINF